MLFQQTYDPFGNPFLSTLLAALPLLLLIYLLALHPWRDKEGRRQRGIGAPKAAFFASLVSLAAAVLVLGMPVTTAGASFVYGAQGFPPPCPDGRRCGGRDRRHGRAGPDAG